jgi:Mn2+/Fe2+ NRAMP family transporter
VKKALSITLGIMTSIGGFLDAGTISTSAQAGASFGFGLIWALVLGTLAVALLVEMAGRLAAVSKQTYASAIRERFGFKFFLVPLVAEFIAETILLAAQLGGVAVSVSLVTGLDWRLLYPVAAIFIWLVVWCARFSVIENGPALLGLVVLSFIAGIIALGTPTRDLMSTLWHPTVEPGEPAGYFFLVAGILGSTISPYLLHFYSSGAREDKWDESYLTMNRITAIFGMGFGSISSIAVMILTAMALQPLHITVNTLGEMGIMMARPFGILGSILFAVTLFAVCTGAALEGLLSLSFMISQGLGWEWGLDERPAQAPRFYLVTLIILVIALIIGVIGGDPLKLALYGSALIALVLPIVLFPLLALMNDPSFLQDHTNHRLANVATAAIIIMASLVALVSMPLLFLSGG